MNIYKLRNKFSFEELTSIAQDFAIKFHDDTMSYAYGTEYKDEGTRYILTDDTERIYNYKGEFVGA